MAPSDSTGEIKFQDVVTVFLASGDKILVLRRSSKVGTYRGRWAGVSGYLETVDPLDQAFIELAEEVSLGKDDVRLIRAGEPLEVVDEAGGRAWRVHPFLFEVHDPKKIRLDWENTELRWVSPEELAGLQTVPALDQALQRVLSEHGVD